LYDGAVADEWDEDTTATGLSNSDPGLRPQPTSRNRACLTVLTGTAAGHMFKLRTGSSLIGRAQNAEVRLVDDGVSRQHASVRYDGKTLAVNDLDSRNGTFVNGTKITQLTKLEDGDKIQVGRTTVLRFAYHDALDESFHESLLSSALRDGLTKLFNKRYLMDRLDSELKFARRHDTAVALLMIDIDHFKNVNDQHGHLAGDAVLASFAQALVKAVRNEDVVARFGGEELAIILRATAIEPALALAERLRRLLEQIKIKFNDSELRATVSIGLAGYPSLQVESPAALVEAADKALYRAKKAGRNRVSR
jgi:diguanylate cyclase (GGDEF)-like protein